MPQPNASVTHPRLSQEEARQLDVLRANRRAHRRHLVTKPPATPEHLALAPPTRGQRLADGVAATIGSWRFIIIQSTAIVIWMTGNVLSGKGAWDPYPFILLNLLLSFQAAYTAPAIMMSQNRQSEMDRKHAATDYEINVKAELEIELLHEKIDYMKERELLALTEAVRDLSAKLEVMAGRVP
jgi:uncharacterized membrane protein